MDQTFSRGTRMRIVAVAIAMTLPGSAPGWLWGQDGTKPSLVQPMAGEAEPGWEVATVRASDPADTAGHDFFLKGHRVALRNITVRQLLLLGYGVQKSQLAGLPQWAIELRWDVDGTPDLEGQLSFQQMQGMVRRLLAERFGLQLHHEQREMGVLALTVLQGRPKLTAHTADPHGWLQQTTKEIEGRHLEEFKNASMAELATVLQYYVDVPLVDQTGLKGRYDFRLVWTVDDTQAVAADAPPELPTALQDELGLKLEGTRALMDVLVIDHVKRPEPN